MTRSKKTAPIVSIACVGRGEMAKYKRTRAKAERARARGRMAKLEPLAENDELAEELVPWDEWSCPRDGKVKISEDENADVLRRAWAK